MAEGNLFVNGVQHHDGEPTFVNGTIIPEFITCKSPGGTEVIVWQNKAEPGEMKWTTPGNYTWEVPIGIKEISICMIGGGGCGANKHISSDFYNNCGGGYAGKIYTNKTLAVTPGEIISLTVGAGGYRKQQVDHNYTGNAGTASSWQATTVAGGAGGKQNNNACYEDSPGYNGNGAIETNCKASVRDGTKWLQLDFNNSYWGGQRGLASGGGGGANRSGKWGSGSSGGIGGTPGNGNGGDGAIFVSWE